MSEGKSLVDALFPEVFQTERSAIRHCAIEAERLGATEPGSAMRLVPPLAQRAEEDLRAHAERRNVRASHVGTAVGAFFSVARDNVADLTLSAEQSYRGTLLGMRHGVDVMALFGAAAAAEGDHALAAWCAEWAAQRAPAVEACARALSWFAAHPERALANAKSKA